MPDPYQNFIDQLNGAQSPSPTPDKYQSFIDAMSQRTPQLPPQVVSPPDTAQGSVTPFVDAAVQQAPWYNRAAKALTIQDPQWLTNFMDRPFLPTAEQIEAFRQKVSPSGPPGFGGPGITAFYNQIARQATPSNAALVGATAAANLIAPPAAPYLNAAVFSSLAAPAVVPTGRGIYHMVTNQATPQEAGETWANLGMFGLPFLHAGGEAAARTLYPLPARAPLPTPGISVQYVRRSPEAAVPPEESVGEPITQEELNAKLASNAQMEGRTAPLGQPAGAGGAEAVPGGGYNVVGEAQGGAARRGLPGEEPIPAPEAVAAAPPETPEAPLSPYFIERHGGVFAVVDRRNPAEVGLITPSLEQAVANKAQLDAAFQKASAKDVLTPSAPQEQQPEETAAPAAGLESQIAAMRKQVADMRDKGRPVPLSLTMGLTDLERQAAQPKVEPIKVEDTSGDLVQGVSKTSNPIEPSQLSTGDQARLAALQQRRGDLQNEVGDYVGTRPNQLSKSDYTRYADSQQQLTETWNQIHSLWEKSGQPYDSIVVGGGPAALAFATHQGYEGKRVLLLEKEPTVGGAAKRSLELFNPGRERTGATGRETFLEKALAARNAGADIRTQSPVTDFGSNPDGTVWAKTQSGQVFHANRGMLATGTRPLTPWEKNPALSRAVQSLQYPGKELAGWGSNGENLRMGSKGGVGVAIGGANSVTQALLGSLRPGGARKVIVVSRSKFDGSEVSPNQYERVLARKRQGKIELITGQVDRITQNRNGTYDVHVRGSRDAPDTDRTLKGVKHVENFLSRIPNTEWMPQQLSRAEKGLIQTLESSHKTNMEGWYAAGDIRNALPTEAKGSRIQSAEGDAIEVSNSILREIGIKQNQGKLPPWHLTQNQILALDEELKQLKGYRPPEPVQPSEQPPPQAAAGEPGQTTGSQIPPSKPISPPREKISPQPLEEKTPSTEPQRQEASRAGMPQPPRTSVQPPPVQVRSTPNRDAIGWDEAITHGREWLARGNDINDVLAKFRTTGKVDTWDMGRMAARLNQLEKATNDTGDALLRKPSRDLQQQHADAVARENQFKEQYAPMYQVAKATLPLKGHEPMDFEAAASPTGMARRFQEFQGRDMSGREQQRMKSMAERSRTANSDYAKANDDLYRKLDTEYGRIRSDRTGPASDESLRQTFSQDKEICGV